jgi:hypothetical protein
MSLFDLTADREYGTLRTMASALSVATVITLGVGHHDAVAQSALDAVDHTRGVVSANEEALIKAQVIHTVTKYYEYFSSGEVERIPQETHLIPYIVLGGGVTASAEAAAEGYGRRRQGVIDDLDADYQTSTYTVRNICVLGSGSPITSGYNTRTRSDGGIISVEGVAYMLTKAPQGWRIAAFSATTPELVIRCEDE